MWVTWAGDAQVIYLLEARPVHNSGYWVVVKKVSGASNAGGSSIGFNTDLDAAKAIAEQDAKEPL